ncbi:MAG: SAM-dependent methyltransferase [Synechococcaceae cyanobacterium]
MTISTNLFPSQEQHARAWQKLAAQITAQADAIQESPPATPPQQPGSLTIIGSGIGILGFTLGDEELIRSADAVFFCVADPATVTWIKQRRPDALDLYVLYDDSKVRYTTYMQMTEAMLAPLRQGKKVVAVYYGHPGIFVLSTHRAIEIARREGHHAVMRPSVSALDCLCADLGVDPAHPGMQMQEATDMLIRSRLPCTQLHVVLWQVGLIGEMGYRRKGYINDNFSFFVRYLQQHYGADYPVTNYIASRFPTIPPVIEHYPLSALHDPDTQGRVTGISTFYLAPRDTAPPDAAMMHRLGMLPPGQQPKPAPSPLRQIGHYGPRERKAFAAFAQFQVPAGYHWQGETAANRFLIALRLDQDLADLYRDDPHAALASHEFADLSDRERSLLASRDAGALQVAAKGSQVVCPANRRLLESLFRQRPLLRRLGQTLASGDGSPELAALQAWASAEGHGDCQWDQMRTDIDLLQRDRLFPWNGIFQSSQPEHLLVLLGDGERARLLLDGQPIERFRYRRGVLRWRATAARPCHGFLRIDLDVRGQRRLVGSIWPEGEAVPADHRLIFREAQPGHQHPAMAVGRYRSAAGELVLAVAGSTGTARQLRLSLNGLELEGSLALQGRQLLCGRERFALERDWRKDPDLAPCLWGDYLVRGSAGLRRLRLSGAGLWLNGVASTAQAQHGQVGWSGGPAGAERGQVTLLLDPISLHPVLHGLVNGQAVVGLVPVAEGAARQPPEFGLSPGAWRTLQTLQAQRAWLLGGLIWHKWERASLYAQIINRNLAKRLP